MFSPQKGKRLFSRKSPRKTRKNKERKRGGRERTPFLNNGTEITGGLKNNLNFQFFDPTFFAYLNNLCHLSSFI